MDCCRRLAERVFAERQANFRRAVVSPPCHRPGAGPLSTLEPLRARAHNRRRTSAGFGSSLSVGSAVTLCTSARARLPLMLTPGRGRVHAARLAIFAIVARLQPVAACIALFGADTTSSTWRKRTSS
jgi:hypothetical protein